MHFTLILVQKLNYFGQPSNMVT